MVQSSYPKRLAAEMDGEFVVYINGMRLNHLRALDKYMIAGRKLAAMFDRLEADPDSGFLGYEPAIRGLGSGAAIQYWRSLEDLQSFAQDPENRHVPARTWVNENVRKGEIGFWAELYVIDDENYETVYRDVPPIGLGGVAELVPMDGHQRRLGLSQEGDISRDPGSVVK
jgi:hypothetical protein